MKTKLQRYAWLSLCVLLGAVSGRISADNGLMVVSSSASATGNLSNSAPLDNIPVSDGTNLVQSTLNVFNDATNAGLTLAPITPGTGFNTYFVISNVAGEGYLDFYTCGSAAGCGNIAGISSDGGGVIFAKDGPLFITENNAYPIYISSNGNLAQKIETTGDVTFSHGIFSAASTDLVLGIDAFPAITVDHNSYNTNFVGNIIVSGGSILGNATIAITAGSPTPIFTAQPGAEVTVTSGNATPGGSAGAAKGGDVRITTGNADRNASGNADGGDIVLNTGIGIGTGIEGRIKVNAVPDFATKLHLVPLGSPPASPAAGDLYYNSGDALCIYTGAAWGKVFGSGSC